MGVQVYDKKVVYTGESGYSFGWWTCVDDLAVYHSL